MRIATVLSFLIFFLLACPGLSQESPTQQIEKAFELYKSARFDELTKVLYAPQEDFLQYSLTLYGKADSLMSDDERLAIENMRLMLESFYRTSLEKSYHQEVVDGKVDWSAVRDFTIDPGEKRSGDSDKVCYPAVFFTYQGNRYAWKPGKCVITEEGLVKSVDSSVTIESR